MGLVAAMSNGLFLRRECSSHYAFMHAEPDLTVYESVGTYVPHNPGVTVLYNLSGPSWKPSWPGNGSAIAWYPGL